jgi:hypothetical protein
LLVEVLSESTEAYDRGSKAAHYRRISSLQEYVFVAQDEPRIEVYRRNDEGGWVLYEARPGERLELRSIGVSLDVSAVYQNPLEANWSVLTHFHRGAAPLLRKPQRCRFLRQSNERIPFRSLEWTQFEVNFERGPTQDVSALVLDGENVGNSRFLEPREFAER